MSSEFWIPAALRRPAGTHQFVYERLTMREQAMLRRLLRGQWPRRRGKELRGSGRISRRDRRKAIEEMGINDLRMLLRFFNDIDR